MPRRSAGPTSTLAVAIDRRRRRAPNSGRNAREPLGARAVGGGFGCARPAARSRLAATAACLEIVERGRLGGQVGAACRVAIHSVCAPDRPSSALSCSRRALDARPRRERDRCGPARAHRDRGPARGRSCCRRRACARERSRQRRRRRTRCGRSSTSCCAASRSANAISHACRRGAARSPRHRPARRASSARAAARRRGIATRPSTFCTASSSYSWPVAEPQLQRRRSSGPRPSAVARSPPAMPSSSSAAARRGLFASAIATAVSARRAASRARALDLRSPSRVARAHRPARAAPCCDGTQLASRHAARRRSRDDDGGERADAVCAAGEHRDTSTTPARSDGGCTARRPAGASARAVRRGERRRRHRAACDQHREHESHHIAIEQLPALRCAACIRSSDWIRRPRRRRRTRRFAPLSMSLHVDLRSRARTSPERGCRPSRWSCIVANASARAWTSVALPVVTNTIAAPSVVSSTVMRRAGHLERTGRIATWCVGAGVGSTCWLRRAAAARGGEQRGRGTNARVYASAARSASTTHPVTPPATRPTTMPAAPPKPVVAQPSRPVRSAAAIAPARSGAAMRSRVAM